MFLFVEYIQKFLIPKEDMEAAIQWLQDCIGARPDAEGRPVFFIGESPMIRAFKLDVGVNTPLDSLNNHIGLSAGSTQEFQGFVASLVANGAVITKAIQEDKDCTYCILSSPHGIGIHVAYRERPFVDPGPK